MEYAELELAFRSILRAVLSETCETETATPEQCTEGFMGVRICDRKFFYMEVYYSGVAELE